MKKNITFVFLFLLSISAFAQEITGSWSGTLDIMGNKLPLVFHISKTDTIYSSKMDSPAQGALGLPTTSTSFADNKLVVTSTGLGITYRGTLQGDSVFGTFTQGGMSFPLVLKQSNEPILNRPQEPKPPFSYKTEDVTFTNKKDKIELAGTLTLPDSAGTFPTVILISGSGPNDRDETVFGHKPFLVIADYLTRNGFAVLRYDKRGVGKSGGDIRLATIQDFAEDAKAAVAFLRSRKDIDHKNIGLLGHSEGGIVAPMVAADNKNIGFIVLMAAPGIPGIDIVMAQNEYSMHQQGMEIENIERLQKLNKENFENLLTWENTEINRTDLRERLSHLWEQLPILLKLKQKKEPFVRSQFNTMVLPGYRSFLKSNPEEFLQIVSVPIFAINGEKDTQVLADKNLDAIKSALDKGRNYQYEIKSYPNLNHLFQESETGNVDEYGKIEQTISPEVLDDITNWLKKQAK